jgi:hypothetical protein
MLLGRGAWPLFYQGPPLAAREPKIPPVVAPRARPPPPAPPGGAPRPPHHRGDSFMTKGAGRIRMENGEYPGFPGVRCK